MKRMLMSQSSADSSCNMWCTPAGACMQMNITMATHTVFCIVPQGSEIFLLPSPKTHPRFSGV